MSHWLFPFLLALAVTPCALGVTVTDPLGDQFPVGGGPLLDLAGITVDLVPAGLQFTISLAAGTTAADLQELSGFVEIDTDMNIATGRSSYLDDFSLEPGWNMGVDYHLEFYPFADEVWLTHGTTDTSWQMQNIIRGVDTVVLTAPLVNDMGGSGIYLTGNQFYLGVLLGTNYGIADRGTNDEVPYLITIPEPAGLTLLAVAAIPCLLARRKSCCHS